MFYNLQFKKFLLFFCNKGSIPPTCFWVIQVILGAEVISWKQKGRQKVRRNDTIIPFKNIHPTIHEFTFPSLQLGSLYSTCPRQAHPVSNRAVSIQNCAQKFGSAHSGVPYEVPCWTGKSPSCKYPFLAHRHILSTIAQLNQVHCLV